MVSDPVYCIYRAFGLVKFLNSGEVFLGIKNNSKKLGNKKILGCKGKFCVSGPCFIHNLPTSSVSKGQKSFEKSKCFFN